MGLLHVVDVEAWDGDNFKVEAKVYRSSSFEHVEVRVGPFVVQISNEVIIDIVADYLVNEEICKLEQLSGKEAIDHLMGVK